MGQPKPPLKGNNGPMLSSFYVPGVIHNFRGALLGRRLCQEIPRGREFKESNRYTTQTDPGNRALHFGPEPFLAGRWRGPGLATQRVAASGSGGGPRATPARSKSRYDLNILGILASGSYILSTTRSVSGTIPMPVMSIPPGLTDTGAGRLPLRRFDPESRSDTVWNLWV